MSEPPTDLIPEKKIKEECVESPEAPEIPEAATTSTVIKCEKSPEVELEDRVEEEEEDKEEELRPPPPCLSEPTNVISSTVSVVQKTGILTR